MGLPSPGSPVRLRKVKQCGQGHTARAGAPECVLPDTLTPSPEPARPGHSHGRAELLLSEGQGRTRVAACAWSLLPPRAASTLPCEPGLPQDNGPGRGGGLAEEEARRQRRGLPKQAAHQEGPWGRGWRPQAAGATGRAPPLPVSSTNGPSSCACAKGKLQLSKTKPPKEELPRRPWKTAGPPPPPEGSLAALPPLPAPGDGRPSLLGEGAEPGQPDKWQKPVAGRTHSPQLPLLTQLLGEDLLESHLAPVLQVLLHDAADAERQRRRGDRAPPGPPTGLLALPWRVNASSPRTWVTGTAGRCHCSL